MKILLGVILGAMMMATPAFACLTAGSVQALVHSELPAVLPASLLAAQIEISPTATEQDLYGAGLRAKVQRTVQGEDVGQHVILRSLIESSCDDPFGNGRSGLIVGVVRGRENGEFVIEPLLVSRDRKHRLPEGYQPSAYYTEPGYLDRVLKDRVQGVAEVYATEKKSSPKGEDAATK